MADNAEKTFEAFRNCITVPKCRDCPWEECEKLKNKKVEIPVDLALAVDALLAEHLKEQETVKPELVGHMWECGNCHTPVGIYLDDRRDDFCRKCGKAVKWNE